MNVGEAKRIIAGLGFPTKMPGTSYGLPASRCITGAKLAAIPGSVCSSCYALRDRYRWGNPNKAQHRRLASLSDPLWIDAMTTMLLHVHAKPIFRIDCGIKDAKRRGIQRFRFNESGFHRWFDSGDLQSVAHLIAINEVAHRTPNIKHWLPTQELGMVNKFISEGWKIAPNLVIRISSIMIEDGHSNSVRRSWPHTSSVFTMRRNDDAHICPAPTQGHRCGSCRACWSSGVPHVAYLKH